METWEKQKSGYLQSLNDFVDAHEKMIKKNMIYDYFNIRYSDIVAMLIKNVFSKISIDGYGEQYGDITFTEIDDGYYQGTILFMIPESTYQPANYILTKINYGSCSACDTLLRLESDYNMGKERCLDWDNKFQIETDEYQEIKEELISGLFTLGLHIIQNAKFV